MNYAKRFEGYYTSEYELKKIIEAYEIYIMAHDGVWENSLGKVHEKEALVKKYRRAHKVITALFTEIQTEHSKEIIEYLNADIENAIDGATTSYEDVRKPCRDSVVKILSNIDIKQSTIDKIIIPIFKDLLHEKNSKK